MFQLHLDFGGVKHSYDCIGEYRLLSLKHRGVGGSRQQYGDDFGCVFSALPHHLHKVEISGGTVSEGLFANLVLSQCKSLKVLRVSFDFAHCVDRHFVASLPHLRVLQISSCSIAADALLGSTWQEHLNQLILNNASLSDVACEQLLSAQSWKALLSAAGALRTLPCTDPSLSAGSRSS